MSNLGQRVLFGALGAAVLLFCIWFSAWTFALFFGLVQMRMLWEFYRMMRKAGYKPASLLGGTLSVVMFTVIHIMIGTQYYTERSMGPIGSAFYAIGIGSCIQLTPLLMKGFGYRWSLFCLSC